MKKIVFIFLVLFCLTGCENSVEFDFNEDIKTTVSLSFTLGDYKSHLNEQNLDDDEIATRIKSIIDFRNAFTDPYSDLFEEKGFASVGNYYSGVYEYTYTYTNFNDNSILHNCFEYFGVKEDENRLYIYVAGKSKCAPFKLIVKADGRMLSSNENVKNGNQYIWNVQESNNDIYMTISKKATTKNGTKKRKEKSSLFSVTDVIFCIVALMIGVGVVFLNKKFKESN